MGPIDELDHSSRLPCYGSKIGIDGTRKWEEEGFNRKWPEEINIPADVKNKVMAIWESIKRSKIR
jgi:4-hydroxy-3-polyprenylbenzoate decarboxylase